MPRIPKYFYLFAAFISKLFKINLIYKEKQRSVKVFTYPCRILLTRFKTIDSRTYSLIDSISSTVIGNRLPKICAPLSVIK
jgi:hypothetical protein